VLGPLMFTSYINDLQIPLNKIAMSNICRWYEYYYNK
jgi:hypothetical protein